MARSRFLGLAQRALSSFGINLSRSDFFAMSSIKEIQDFYDSCVPKSWGHELLRIGGDHDGGYVVPNDLNGITYCLSPGCNLLSKFERHLFQDFNIPSQICDLPEYLPDQATPGLEFIPKLLGLPDSDFLTLEQWIKQVQKKDSDELILQMDIEGAEYEILKQASPTLLQTFRVIVMEFHFLDLLKYKYFSEKEIVPVFEKLLEYFDVVNVNANNACGYWFFGLNKFPPIIEVTFHRKDRRKIQSPELWQSGLNQANVPALKEVLMPWQLS